MVFSSLSFFHKLFCDHLGSRGKQLPLSLLHHPALQENKIDMVVLAGFLGILSGDLIDRFGGPIINIHPALIPSFCGKGMYGLRPHQAALEYGVKVTGATVHYVNAIPDGGKIIAQKAVEILPGDTAEVLQRRVMEQAEWKILPAAAEQVAKELVEKR